MDSGGRSERNRVGSDGGRTRYQGGTYQGYVMKEMAFSPGGSQAEWHRGYNCLSAQGSCALGFFFIRR